MVVLFGFDGCGKSTLITHLRTRRYPCTRFLDLYPCSPQGISPSRFHYRDLETQEPTARARQYRLLAERWLASCIQPLASERRFVVDSYIYRYSSKERIWNPHAAAMTRELDASVPRPGLAILLDTPIAVAYARNLPGHRSDYHPGFERTPLSFATLQLATLADQFHIYSDFRVPVITVDATLSPEALSDHVARHLLSSTT